MSTCSSYLPRCILPIPPHNKPTHSSIYPISTHLLTYPPTHLPVLLSIHPLTYLPICVFTIHPCTYHLSIHPPLTLLAIHLSAISYLLSICLSTSAIHTTHPSRHAAISPPIPLCSRTPSARLSLHQSTVPLPIQPCLELLTVSPSTSLTTQRSCWMLGSGHRA